jgi:hypothetical protein
MSQTASNKSPPAEYTARLEAEKAALANLYCNVFRFWAMCPLRRCRKARRCSGDPHVCLKRRHHEVPRDVQWRARQNVLAATLAHAGSAERMAQEFLPGNLCA